MNKFRYYAMLAIRYRLKHPLQTLYSLIAIMIAVVLCFCSITLGMELLDYPYYAAMKERKGCELTINEFAVGQDSITDKDMWTLQKFQEMEKKAAALPEVERTYLYKLPSTEAVSEEDAVDESGDAANDTEEDVAADDSDAANDTEENVSSDNSVPADEQYELYVKVKDNSNLNQSAKIIEKKLGYQVQVDPDIQVHLGQGSADDSLTVAAEKAIFAMVGAVFALFAMLVIRNTMMLPVFERMKEYGAFRCAGMSSGQLYCMLSVEGILLTLISTVFGTGVGFGILKLGEGMLNAQMDLNVPLVIHFRLSAVLLSGLLCIGVTMLALLEPARQASKQSVTRVLQGGSYGITNTSKTRQVKHKNHWCSRFMGRIFGAEWEYAMRSMSRSPGGQFYLFVGVTVSMMLFAIVFTSIDSTYATFENSLQGSHQEYSEALVSEGTSTLSELKDRSEELRKLKSVKNAGVYLQSDFALSNLNVTAHYKDLDTSRTFLSVAGYDKKHLDHLKRQLVAGSIAYDKLVREHGVVLCDYEYNINTSNGDATATDKRLTDYKVGDSIEVISREADAQVTKDIRAVKQAMDKKQQEPDEKADPKIIKKYWDKVTALVRKKGYDISKYQKTQLWSQTYYSYFSLRSLMEQCKIDAGSVEHFKIQAIIKEDTYNSSWMTSYVPSHVGIMMADQSLFQYFIPSASYENMTELDGRSYGRLSLGVGVNRHLRFPTDEINAYVKKCNQKYTDANYHWATLYETGYDDITYSDIYGEIQNTLDLVRTCGLAVGGFLLLICLMQIYNVTMANLSTRRQEIYLFRVAGMTRGQLQRMIFLENGISCLAGILAGIACGYMVSHYAITQIMAQDGGLASRSGGVLYVWPIGKIVLIAVVIYVFCMLAGHVKKKMIKN